MQALQKEILQRYKEIYPTDTLREISERTGIHFVRVYRLFNEYEMKLAEYEIFLNVINKQKLPPPQMHSLLDECLNELSKDSILRIKNQMLNLLSTKKLINNKNNIKFA
jgi:hypothetical protein